MWRWLKCPLVCKMSALRMVNRGIRFSLIPCSITQYQDFFLSHILLYQIASTSTRTLFRVQDSTVNTLDSKLAMALQAEEPYSDSSIVILVILLRFLCYSSSPHSLVHCALYHGYVLLSFSELTVVWSSVANWSTKQLLRYTIPWESLLQLENDHHWQHLGHHCRHAMFNSL